MTLQRRDTAIVPEPGGGYLPVSPDDYSLPVLKLIQATSAASGGAHPGEFACAQTGEHWEAFPAIVLRVQVTRHLFGPDLGPPLCVSPDGVMPTPGMQYPGPCATCEMRLDMPWTVSAEERRSKCTKGYALLVLDATGEHPYMLRVGGASVGAVRDLNTAYRHRCQGEPFRVLTILKSAQRTNALGRFWVLSPVLGEAVAGPIQVRARAMAQRWAIMPGDALGEATEDDEGSVPIAQPTRAPVESPPSAGAKKLRF